MPDYSKTKIYKIWSYSGDKIYIGSTCKNYLSERMTVHRFQYTQWKKNNTRARIRSYDLFEEYGIKNCMIELIEATPCNNKDEKKKHEGRYIRILNCVNIIVPDRTKEEMKEMTKKYYEENKEMAKKYYEKNKEKILERKKLYREQNMNEYIVPIKKKTSSKDKIICSCGSEYRRDNTRIHITTKKHINYITSQIPIS